MLALRVVDECDGGPGDPREIRCFPGMVHPDLDHRRAVLAAQAEQRQRQADLVVEVAVGCQHVRLAPVLAQATRDHLLDRGLSIRPCHRRKRQIEAPAPMSGERAEPRRGIRYRSKRQGRSKRRRAFVPDQGGRGTRARRLRHEIVSIEARAGQRHEQIAALHAPAVGAHGVELHIRAAQFARQSARRFRELHHRHACPSVARTTAPSLKRCRTPRIS